VYLNEKMKNLFKEIFWIIALASFIALIYNFASKRSIPLIPKTLEEQTVSNDELLAGIDDNSHSNDQLNDIDSNAINSNLINKSNSTENFANKKDTSTDSSKTSKDSQEKKDLQQTNTEKNDLASKSNPKINPSTQSEQEPTDLKFVTYKQVKQLVGKPGVQFIDARSSEFFTDGTIGNSINLHPWKDGMPFIDNNVILKLQRNLTYIVFCTGGTCTDSHEIAERMLQLGFTKVYVYYNGYDEWEKFEKINRPGS